MTSRASFRFQIAALCLLAFAPFVNTFNNPFLYDDIAYVLENTHFRNPPSFSEILLTPYPPQMENLALYRPLVTFSFIFDRSIWGLKPGGFHLTNILLHIAATLVLYFLARELAPDRRVAFFAGALFAVHPIHTESVAWIVGRAEVGSALFFMLALYLYLISASLMGGRKALALTGSSLSFFFALLAKETALVLPGVIILYEFIYRPGSGKRTKIGRLALRLLPYIGVLSVYIAMRLHSLPSFGPGPEGQYFKGLSLYARSLTMLKGMLYYIKLTILPANYSVDYDFYISISTSLFDASLAPALIGAAFSLVIMFKAAHRSKLIIFSIGFFLIALAPVSNLLPIGLLLAERLLYLPSAAFVLALAGLLSRAQMNRTPSAFESAPGRMAILIFCAIVALYAASTLKRNTYWRDEGQLWSKTIQSNPRSLRAVQKLGDVYKKKRLQDKAIAQYFTALGHKVKYKETYNNLANIFMDKGLLRKAFYFYNEALFLDPAYADAANNLGITYKKAFLRDKAIFQYGKALWLSPSFAAAHKNIAIAFMEDMQYGKAFAHLKESLRIDPSQDDAADMRRAMAEMEKKIKNAVGW